jgi:hypothetical protein
MRPAIIAVCWASAVMYAWAAFELGKLDTLAATVGAITLAAQALRNLLAPWVDEPPGLARRRRIRNSRFANTR